VGAYNKIPDTDPLITLTGTDVKTEIRIPVGKFFI